MRKYFFFVSLLTSVLFASTVNVAVAANLGHAIKDIEKLFGIVHPDIKLRITLGSSGKLAAQIRHGAPYELFLSANTNFPQTLFHTGYALEQPRLYTKGQLVLFSSRSRDFSKGLDLLQDKEIKKIVMANPKTAPYGQAALEVLKRAKLLTKLKPRLVYSESVSQAVSYALLAADTGFIAKSALFTPKMRRFEHNKHWIDIPQTLYAPIEQSMVLLKKAKPSDGARLFYDFLVTQKAQEVFLNHGYKAL